MDVAKVKKVLILSCGTGEGHNSAAGAIAEALGDIDVKYEIKDPLSIGSHKAGKRLSTAYTSMLRYAPRFFNLIYDAGEYYERKALPSPVYRACAHFAGELADYIRAGGFSSVVCTHLFAMEAMRAAREVFSCQAPFYALHTDYACIPFLSETHADAYFVASSDDVFSLSRRGISVKDIYNTGIPVSRRFFEHTDRKDARQKLGLGADGDILLIMCGGAGCGRSGGRSVLRRGLRRRIGGLRFAARGVSRGGEGGEGVQKLENAEFFHVFLPRFRKKFKERCKFHGFLIAKNLVLVYNENRIVRTRNFRS